MGSLSYKSICYLLRTDLFGISNVANGLPKAESVTLEGIVGLAENHGGVEEVDQGVEHRHREQPLGVGEKADTFLDENHTLCGKIEEEKG